MKIRSVRINEFKRFTDLDIREIPENAKLVVLVGPNGTGKSSLFEAFNFWISPARGVSYQQDYHWKVGHVSHEHWGQLHQKINIEFYTEALDPSSKSEKVKKAFYFRSAYRHEPDFSARDLSQIDEILTDSRRPSMMISHESRVSDNYRRIVATSIKDLYDREKKAVPAGEIIERIIGKVREAMQRVFEDLNLTGPGEPLLEGTFLFEKGASRDYRYKNLSGGEKAAFDLLLDFIIKTETFNDTVFCVDEPELHMHTKLQSRLLDELYRQLPDNCQLWIATHSIGMTRRAMEIYKDNPSEVVFLDFEDRNFDTNVIITPAIVDRQFWKRVFTVALDDLAELIAPSQVVFCEGRPEREGRRRNTTFDADIYRRIFRTSHPDTEFVPLGGANDIEKNSVLISGIFKELFRSMQIWNLLDRDDRSDEEIERLNAEGTQVLHRRDLENYLWDDEILTKLCNVKEQDDLTAQVLEAKANLMREAIAAGNSADDIKAISGPLYVQVKRLLRLRQCGNTTEEFARVTLAPLITPDTSAYRELEAQIFGARLNRNIRR